MSAASEVTITTLHLHDVVRRAILVSKTGDIDAAFWLPQADVAFERLEQDRVRVLMLEPTAERWGLM